MLDQLTLGIRLHDEANFDSFFVGDNEELVSTLKSFAAHSAWNYIYLSGNSSVGKSHLLQACCQSALTLQYSAFYLPLGKEFSPLILEDLASISLVCIDNIDIIAGMKEWEEALFHLFNQSLQNKTRLIIAGKYLPGQCALSLPDLASRLVSGLTYRVKPLTDEQKLCALQLRAYLRGFELSLEVGQYLLNHCSRQMTTLLELLERLDLASFEAQHRLTIPFVKSVLKTNK